jgi:hypothetical protein
MIAMKPIRLPEGGRAALSFAFEGDWRATQEAARTIATRANIFRLWKSLPDWVRRDQGFQALMDNYCPVLDETLLDPAVYARKLAFWEKASAADWERLRQAGRDVAGNDFNPDHPISDDEVMEALGAVPMHRACVDYGVTFGGGTALATNSTTRTIVGIKCPANQANRIWGFDVGFDGTTSTNGPAYCELDTNTWATNAPGTNSTSVTPNPNDSARPETIQSTAAKAWTTEPTVLSPVELFFIPNYMGSGIVFTPLTKPFGAKGGNGCSMRVTQQSGITANVTGTLKSEE